MDAQRPKKIGYWEFYEKVEAVLRRLDGGGEEVVQPAPFEEEQASSACNQQPALAGRGEGEASPTLMERICDPANLNRAYERVLANKGAPGVDGRTVKQLAGWIRQHKRELIDSLLDGSYRPQEVRGVQIPKPGGGMRQLGIPTVVDRLVQQAILQVLDPILDPNFSETSYGFRVGCSAHDALARARQYVAGGRHIVVDIDLEKFLDTASYCTPVHARSSNSA